MMIPTVTTEAGRSLTMANWQSIGIQRVSYHLSELLIKPGFDALHQLPDLAAYVGQSIPLVLNASLPHLNGSGGFSIRSRYDGTRHHYTLDEWVTIIMRLQPAFVLLPKNLPLLYANAALSWPSFPFFSPEDCPLSAPIETYGVYFYYDGGVFSAWIDQLKPYLHHTCYALGDFDLSQLRALADIGVAYVESDLPARDALLGQVYHSQSTTLSLTDPIFTNQHDVIDLDCHCPTCFQGLSKAYLHHLLKHTPLLCQRFLIQHNAYRARSVF